MNYLKLVRNLCFFVVSSTLIASATAQRIDPWSFLVLADWHGAEYYAIAPGPDSQLYKNQVSTFSDMHDKYGGDLIIMPGDTQSGNWDVQAWREKHYPNLSVQDAIYTAGINCWTTMKSLFSDAGYDKVLVAIGDHEIGDNAWHPHSPKTVSLPQFRSSFVRALYFDHATGTTNMYANQPIGNAPATPYGTTFENTSFAHRHKNALFITVDSFYQISANDFFFDRREGGLGGEGVITGDVAGAHLEWFENVLKEARKDPTIKHIFVQSHLPVLNPVRKTLSSAMFFDRGPKSKFWQLMVQYGVDVYFAGEVHANTALKDEFSNTLQIVSKGGNCFVQVLVDEDSFTVNNFYETGEKYQIVKYFEKFGSIMVNKTNPGDVQITSSGTMRLVDVRNPIMHFTFDEVNTLWERQVLGLSTRELIRARQIDMRGMTLVHAMPNYGEFGQQYDAQVGGITLKRGEVSKSAGIFNGHMSNMGIFSVGPLVAGNVISYSLWFKTRQKSEAILIHFGHGWNSRTSDEKDMFTLTLDGGSPKLYARSSSILQSSEPNGLALNDNGWHQLAISMPYSGCNLSQVKMFVDGALISTTVRNDVTLFFVNHGRLSMGGLGFSATTETEFPSWNRFIGQMDEVYIWARTIWKNDLVNSPKRIFVKEMRNTCAMKRRRGIKIQKLTNLKRKNKCRKRCSRLTPCLGFKVVTQNEGTETVACTLYLHRRPKFKVDEEQEGRNNTLCAT